MTMISQVISHLLLHYLAYDKSYIMHHKARQENFQIGLRNLLFPNFCPSHIVSHNFGASKPLVKKFKKNFYMSN